MQSAYGTGVPRPNRPISSLHFDEMPVLSFTQPTDGNDPNKAIWDELSALRETSLEQAQEYAFRILHKNRLLPIAEKLLRQMPPPSISETKWEYVAQHFDNLLNGAPFFTSDYRSIRSYCITRSRLPMTVFKEICRQLDLSRKTLGKRRNLENEIAVQSYLQPIFTTILGLFQSRLTNLPALPCSGSQKDEEGQQDHDGHCKSTISLFGRSLLVIIQVKNIKPGNRNHSDLIAKVIAEAMDVDKYNKEKYQGIPIHAILTNGTEFECFHMNFETRTILRGHALTSEGFSYSTHRLYFPEFEGVPQYLASLKADVEAIFDTFLNAYLAGIMAQIYYLRRLPHKFEQHPYAGYHAGSKETGNSTKMWEIARSKCESAQEKLYNSHQLRIQDPVRADEMAEEGLLLLKESVKSIHLPNDDWSLLDNWDEKATQLKID